MPEAASQILTVLSSDADARRLSSCEKATDLTDSLWPSSVWRHVPEAASQILTVLSSDADARRLSSCEKATDVTDLPWPSSVWRHRARGRIPDLDGVIVRCRCEALVVVREGDRRDPLDYGLRASGGIVPEAASQILTVLSSDADARRLSSCEKATDVTHALWPSSVWRHLPEAASQILTVLSSDADARRLSSCEKATDVTHWLWPSSVWRHGSPIILHSRLGHNPFWLLLLE